MCQIEYTNRILGSIQKGLLLEVQETGIYAWRQDRCHVFASTSDPNVAEPDPKKLPQNAMVELLSFQKYVHGRLKSPASFSLSNEKCLSESERMLNRVHPASLFRA